MKRLKNVTWDDKWQNWVLYGQPNEPIDWKHIDRPRMPKMPSPYDIGILNIMDQLKGKMTVYEAFIKAIEIKAASYTENSSNSTQRLLHEARKLEMKNLKKGIVNEELHDYIEALYRGWKEWIERPYDIQDAYKKDGE